MKKSNTKRVVLASLLMLIMMIAIPTLTQAANEDVALVKINENYNIYLKELQNKEFKFAFTNDSTLEQSNVTSELNFVANWDDTNGANIACLESTTAIDFNQPVYMWIESEGENSEKTYTSVELNLSEAISKEEMADVENLTKIISVDTKQTTTTKKDINGVATSVTVGQINITDSQSSQYKYQLIKIDGTESATAKNLISEVNSLQNTYSSLSIYEKVLATKKVNDLYVALQAEANWSDVENMTIHQPDDSKQDDEYIVLLQKITNGDVEANDIQFLKCMEDYKPEVVKEKKEVKKASALPVTYDSIILFVILGVVVVAAIFVVIKMKKVKDEEIQK